MDFGFNKILRYFPVILLLMCRDFSVTVWFICRVYVLRQPCCKRNAIYRKLNLCCAVFGLFCPTVFLKLIPHVQARKRTNLSVNKSSN
jgi:hypothetical protein